jgi:uncharacterized phiE125 gp8 family phage protein
MSESLYWADFGHGVMAPPDSHWAAAVTIPPAVEPCSLQEAKDWLYITHDQQNAVIRDLIRAARTKVEQDTSRKLLTQTVKLSLDDFPCGPISLLMAPVQSVTSIVSYNSLDVPATFAAASYRLDAASEPPRVLLTTSASWPSDLRLQTAVEVTFVAGWTDPALVPDDLKFAIRILLVALWERRGMTGDEERAYERFIRGWTIAYAA